MRKGSCRRGHRQRQQRSSVSSHTIQPTLLMMLLFLLQRASDVWEVVGSRLTDDSICCVALSVQPAAE